MLIKDLFYFTPITEDLAAPLDPTDNELPKFDPAYSKVIGTIEGHDIWGSRWYGSKYDTYGIKDGDDLVAFTVVNTNPINVKKLDGTQIKAFSVDKVWVQDKYRGKGLASSLIMYIVKKAKNPLISGGNATIMGQSSLEKQLKRNFLTISSIEKYDTNFKQIDVDPIKMIKTGSENQQLLFEINSTYKHDVLFGHGYRICSEYRFLDLTEEWD